MKSAYFLASIGLFALLVTPAFAGFTYDFERITSNTPSASDIPLIQMDISVANDIVSFTFSNLVGSPNSTITKIYFDDMNGLLGGPGNIVDGLGVSFLPEGALIVNENGNGKPKVFSVSPGDLPGGAPFGFEATAALSLGIEKTPADGINPGDWLVVEYALQGSSITDVTSALDNETLQIGLHVQQLGPNENYSDSFVIVHAPAPSALLLGSLGVGMFGWLRRKRIL